MGSTGVQEKTFFYQKTFSSIVLLQNLILFSTPTVLASRANLPRILVTINQILALQSLARNHLFPTLNQNNIDSVVQYISALIPKT